MPEDRNVGRDVQRHFNARRESQMAAHVKGGSINLFFLPSLQWISSHFGIARSDWPVI